MLRWFNQRGALLAGLIVFLLGPVWSATDTTFYLPAGQQTAAPRLPTDNPNLQLDQVDATPGVRNSPAVNCQFGSGAQVPQCLTRAGYVPYSSVVSFSRAGNAMQYDSTGKLTYAPNNQLLNSATLSTQSVTTVPANYILSFSGTGTVTLTGTSTAGPLVGTGASNRVFLAFTPTAGSLTLTVSGSVTSAQLELVTYQTTPSTYNPTTSAAYFGPRFDYDPVTLLPNGLLIEEARTNLILQSAFASGWTAASSGGLAPVPTLNSAAAPDGSTTAVKLVYPAVSSANNYSVYFNSYTATAASYSDSVWLKGNSGGEQLYISSTPDGVTYFRQAVTLTTSWQRFSVTGIKTAAIWFFYIGVDLRDGSQSAKAAQTIFAWGAQGELGAFATSYITTAAASVTRAADVAQLTGQALAALQGASGAVGVEWTPEGNDAANQYVVADNGNGVIFASSAGLVETTNGSNVLSSGGTQTVGSPGRALLTWGSSSRAISFNSSVPASDAHTVGTHGTQYLGGNNGSNVQNGWYRSVAFYNKALSNSVLQAKSIVGAPY